MTFLDKEEEEKLFSLEKKYKLSNSYMLTVDNINNLLEIAINNHYCDYIINELQQMRDCTIDSYVKNFMYLKILEEKEKQGD